MSDLWWVLSDLWCLISGGFSERQQRRSGWTEIRCEDYFGSIVWLEYWFLWMFRAEESTTKQGEKCKSRYKMRFLRISNHKSWYGFERMKGWIPLCIRFVKLFHLINSFIFSGGTYIYMFFYYCHPTSAFNFLLDQSRIC